MIILLIIIPIICFLIMEAFFSGSETAIISANKMRLKALADRGDTRAKLASQLFKKPERLLGTTLVGTNISTIAATTLASIVVSHLLLRSRYITDQTGLETTIATITTLTMTPFILIFGEIIPKSICRAKANSMALTISPLLKWASTVLYPVVTVVTKVSSSLALIFSRRSGHKPFTVKEELRFLARLSEKEGLLGPQQRQMIHSVFDLERQIIGSAMVPLIDVMSIEKNTSLEEFYDLVAETRFSRFPVYDERVDNIIGLVNVLDVLYSTDSAEDISQFISDNIIYFPESKHITTSLQELQRGHHPMAFVVDEYGGVTGMITIEDLVEEIVGEIRNEWVHAKDGFDESTLECDGRVEIDEINERLGTDIPKHGYETIAGFVIDQMDKIPAAGEETAWKNLRIIVLEADRRSVSKVKFIVEERKENEAETGDTEG